MIVIPKDLIQKIICAHHNPPLSGHLSISKSIKSIQIKYYWTTLIKEVILFIKICHLCQINKKAPSEPANNITFM